MAKRGRPRKHPLPESPQSFEAIWANALKLASTITDHYSMRRNEQSLILQYALLLGPGATLVELGVTHGRTAAILCYAAKLNEFYYVGVDNFSVEGSAKETLKNLSNLGLPNKILVGDTLTVPWDSPIDFLIIDAGHDVVNVTQDSERWLPFVRPGGLVVFHDYNRNIDQNDPHWGIKNAVERFCANWETINQIEWLIIKRKPLT
jgi:predicted O-methyltransferase YrrM